MHCDRTRTARVIDLTLTGNPDSVKAEVLRFIAGIKGPRLAPAIRSQITAWLRQTPAEAIDGALQALVADQKIEAAIGGYLATKNGMPAGFVSFATELADMMEAKCRNEGSEGHRKPKAERAYTKAQFWLNRAKRLRGWE